MKTPLHFILALSCLLASQSLHAQGWRAIVVLNFGSGLYPLATVDYATVTFQGGSGYGWSSTSYVQFMVTGEGSPAGPVYIQASGRSLFNSQATTYVSVVYMLTDKDNCELYMLDADPAVNRYVSGQIMMFPRQRITEVEEGCDRVTLTTDVCSDAPYKWEVSASVAGPYKVIAEDWNQSIDLSSEDLADLGLARYGRKFFRVTGGTNTTSLVEVADFYPPGPSATFTTEASNMS